MDEQTHQPLLTNLSLIAETAHQLRQDGHRVVIVSSGAIGVGLRRMNEKKRPKHLAKLQALAAIGQCRLMGIWDSLFSHLEQPVAQILLTRNDIADVGAQAAQDPEDLTKVGLTQTWLTYFTALQVPECAEDVQRVVGHGSDSYCERERYPSCV